MAERRLRRDGDARAGRPARARSARRRCCRCRRRRPGSGEAGDGAGAVGVAAGVGEQRECRRRASSTNTTAASAAIASRSAAASSRASSSRQDRGIDQPPDQRVVGVGGRADVFAACRAAARPAAPLRAASSRSRVRAERLEDFGRLLKVTIGGRARAGARRQTAERELTDARPDSVRRPARTRSSSARCRDTPRWFAIWRARRSPRSRRNSPHAPGVVRGSRRASTCAEALLGFVERPAAEQRLDRDQLALQGFGRRRGGRLRDFVGDGQRRVGRAAADREPRRDHANRPLVPAAGLPAVGAVGFGRALQILGRVLVVAAHQRHLRQRVVDARRWSRGSARRCALRARDGAPCSARARLPMRTQIWPSVASATASAGSGPRSSCSVDGAFGQRQRLVVAVPDQRDVRLVDADDREHVVGAQRRGLRARRAAAPPTASS